MCFAWNVFYVLRFFRTTMWREGFVLQGQRERDKIYTRIPQ